MESYFIVNHKNIGHFLGEVRDYNGEDEKREKVVGKGRCSKALGPAEAGTERPRKYWNDLKKKLPEEGYAELSEKIGQLKLMSGDGQAPVPALS